MKPLLFSAALLVASAGLDSASLAAGSYKGINLGWLDCPNQGEYQQVRGFACDTNEGGGHTLVGSFVAGPGMLAVTGYAAVIDVQTSGPTLAAWWELRPSFPPGCRAGSMVHSTDFTGGPFNCFDYWQGGAAGGATAEVPVANRTRLRSTAALPANDSRIGPIAAGTEVYAFKLTINNAKTVGPGSCGGCGDEACITLNSILATQVPGTPGGNFTIANPAVTNYAHWLGWSTTDPAHSCPMYSPVKDRTWGAIKAFYR